MESLQGAKNSRKSLTDKVRSLAEKAKSGEQGGDGKNTAHYIEGLNKAIEDDLSTPRALADLWGLLKEGPVSQDALSAVFDMDSILALGLEDAVKGAQNGKDESLSLEIEELIAKRSEAKKAKDFAAADNIRQSLKDRGIILEDGPGGTTWKRL
jgi:cysteinyl-tRNA synthetase